MKIDYISDLHLDHYMIFGHTHEKLTFKKANSTVLMNCWGYEEHNIEIKTFEL